MKLGSISLRPGMTGTFFYERAFQLLGIEGTYKALKCNNVDEIRVIAESGQYSGLSISMPFKSQVMILCSDVDSSTFNGESVNTIKFTSDGRIVGYNTDQSGVDVAVSHLAPGKSSILGSGSMAKCFARELEKRGLEYEMYSRKLGNWDERTRNTSNLINCTPIGMDGISVPVSDLSGIATIVDLPIASSEFRKRAKAAGVEYFSGLEFYGFVFLKQLNIYTGKEITRTELEEIKKEWNLHA